MDGPGQGPPVGAQVHGTCLTLGALLRPWEALLGDPSLGCPHCPSSLGLSSVWGEAPGNSAPGVQGVRSDRERQWRGERSGDVEGPASTPRDTWTRQQLHEKARECPRTAPPACRKCSVGWGPATSPQPSEQAFPSPCAKSEGNTVRLSPSQSGREQRVRQRVSHTPSRLLEPVQVSHPSPCSQTCHSTGFIRCLVPPGDEIPVGQERPEVSLCASTRGGSEI